MLVITLCNVILKRMARIHSPITYYGGKFFLAQRITQLFQPHALYVEPFAGGLNVLFYKPPSRLELVSDIDSELVNLYKVMKEYPAKFSEIVSTIPYNRGIYNQAIKWLAQDRTWVTPDNGVFKPSIRRAIAYLVRNRMSFSGLGVSFRPPFASKTSQAKGKSQYVKMWDGVKVNLPHACARLSDVRVVNLDAIDLIRRCDSKNTLFYLDPPYIHSTRKAGTTDWVYCNEMTDAAHAELLDVITGCVGQVYISGYANELYDSVLTAGWHRVEWSAKTSCVISDKALSHRVEVLWWKPMSPSRAVVQVLVAGSLVR